MPPTVSGVRKKQFSTPARTTDSDSDVDYSELPLTSNTSRSHKSSNGINDFTCVICKRRSFKEQSLKTHVYWHTMEPQEESQSETSEDVPILSSGAENDYELFHICDGNIVGNGPLKQLNLRDFNVVYGEEFMERNQEYVTDFLNELHQCQNEFEEGTHEPQISDVEDISDEPQISDVEDNNDNTIE